MKVKTRIKIHWIRVGLHAHMCDLFIYLFITRTLFIIILKVKYFAMKSMDFLFKYQWDINYSKFHCCQLQMDKAQCFPQDISMLFQVLFFFIIFFPLTSEPNSIIAMILNVVTQRSVIFNIDICINKVCSNWYEYLFFFRNNLHLQICLHICLQKKDTLNKSNHPKG